MRVGLVGAGGIARVHLRCLLELGAEVRVFSPSGAGRLTAELGGEAVGSLEELLAGADGVLVCSPTPSHPDVVRAALAAGVGSVVCEKPLARTAGLAREVVAAHDEVGAELVPAHVVRWFTAYADLHAAVREGRLGALSTLAFTRIGSLPERTWFLDAEQSGGVVLDLMLHDLDAARWIAGEVESVEAHESRGPDGWSATAVLTHVGGVTSTVTATWGPPDTEFRTTLSANGSGGSVSHDSLLEPDPSDPYLEQLREVLATLAGGPPARVTAADGVAAVELAEAVLRAVATGDRVRMAHPR